MDRLSSSNEEQPQITNTYISVPFENSPNLVTYLGAFVPADHDDDWKVVPNAVLWHPFPEAQEAICPIVPAAPGSQNSEDNSQVMNNLRLRGRLDRFGSLVYVTRVPRSQINLRVLAGPLASPPIHSVIFARTTPALSGIMDQANPIRMRGFAYRAGQEGQPLDWRALVRNAADSPAEAADRTARRRDVINRLTSLIARLHGSGVLFASSDLLDSVVVASADSSEQQPDLQLANFGLARPVPDEFAPSPARATPPPLPPQLPQPTRMPLPQVPIHVNNPIWHIEYTDTHFSQPPASGQDRSSPDTGVSDNSAIPNEPTNLDAWSNAARSHDTEVAARRAIEDIFFYGPNHAPAGPPATTSSSSAAAAPVRRGPPLPEGIYDDTDDEHGTGGMEVGIDFDPEAVPPLSPLDIIRADRRLYGIQGPWGEEEMLQLQQLQLQQQQREQQVHEQQQQHEQQHEHEHQYEQQQQQPPEAQPLLPRATVSDDLFGLGLAIATLHHGRDLASLYWGRVRRSMNTSSRGGLARGGGGSNGNPSRRFAATLRRAGVTEIEDDDARELVTQLLRGELDKPLGVPLEGTKEE